MSKPKVFVCRLIAREALDRIAGAAETDVWQGELPPPYEVLLEKASGSDGLLTLLTDRMDANLMDNSPNLKVISNMAVGYDNIQIDEATKRNIVVGYTPGVLTETTADFAFALMMAAARRVVEGVDTVRAGRWQTWGLTTLLGQDVHGASLGIVGLGRIGEAVARRARGFNMRLLYHDRRRRPELEAELGLQFLEFDRLLAESDFVTLHVNLTPRDSQQGS